MSAVRLKAETLQYSTSPARGELTGKNIWYIPREMEKIGNGGDMGKGHTCILKADTFFFGGGERTEKI